VTETPAVPSPATTGSALEEVAARIRRHGPLPFDEVMRIALYDPAHGFYATGGAAGRRGDFITSVEVGPLFGAVIARALDAWWDELGRPDPFVVIEGAAGSGTLARAVLHARPACLPALTYVLVERSAPLRERQHDHLQITGASHALPPRDEDAETVRDVASGPRFVSLPDLPIGPVTGVILANELLDNLPIKLLELVAPGEWCEVRVGLTPDERELVEYLVPADPSLLDVVAGLDPTPAVGARVPVQLEAADWVRRAAEVLERGRLALLDYADTTASFAARASDEWLRTYRGHERGTAALHDLGYQDITCEVAIDQVGRVRSGLEVETQAAFLRRFGIEELVEEGRQIWHERGHIGDLEAIRGRSRVNEATALLDAGGLGAFSVLHWRVLPR
jgi:SAM-dependent MidA family methyltransferase